jgi:hypothetical protein
MENSYLKQKTNFVPNLQTFSTKRVKTESSEKIFEILKATVFLRSRSEKVIHFLDL